MQDHANDLLNLIAKKGQERLEAAMLSYGAGPDGSVDFRTTFEGPLAGRWLVTGTELAAGAIRVVETTETISNGIGGLIKFNRKRPIYLDVGPLAGITAGPVYQAAAGLVADWRQRHPQSTCPPVVLHLTRGSFDPDEAAPAIAGLLQAGGLLYYLVVSDAPHRAVAYPDTAEKIDDPVLRKLWEQTSRLLSAPRLAAEKKTLRAQRAGNSDQREVRFPDGRHPGRPGWRVRHNIAP